MKVAIEPYSPSWRDDFKLVGLRAPGLLDEIVSPLLDAGYTYVEKFTPEEFITEHQENAVRWFLQQPPSKEPGSSIGPAGA